MAWIPESTHLPRCLSLGAPSGELRNATAAETGLSSAIPVAGGVAGPESLSVATTADDAVWIRAWGRANPGLELAFVLNGWLIAVEPARELVPDGTPTITIPIIGLRGSMGAAVATAINVGPNAALRPAIPIGT